MKAAERGLQVRLEEFKSGSAVTTNKQLLTQLLKFHSTYQIECVLNQRASGKHSSFVYWLHANSLTRWETQL